MRLSAGLDGVLAGATPPALPTPSFATPLPLSLSSFADVQFWMVSTAELLTGTFET
jgi:hypothetical protein